MFFFRFFLEAPNPGLKEVHHSGFYLLRLLGFQDVAVGLQGHDLHNAFLVILSGKENDRNALGQLVLPQGLEHIGAGHAGHAVIQQHQVHRVLGQEVYGRLGANYDGDGPGALRRIPQEDLDELKAIYDVTGGTERIESVERFSKAKAEEIKNSSYALGKAPENLTDNQQNRIAMMAENNNRLYRAYRMKEMLRLLLKIKDTDEAEDALKRWLWWASHSRIDAFKELYLKIKRHREHILNAIRLGMSNARIEATNNKIKLIVRKAYGFRNIQNMLDMVYLVCSDLKVPLPNRKPRGALSA